MDKLISLIIRDIIPNCGQNALPIMFMKVINNVI